MIKNKIELLSPAGNFDCALAAFTYGADAVYLGLKNFSARNDAINFSENELFDIVKIAHGLSKKVYVAFNTVVQNCDIDSVVEQLDIINRAKVDGLIVQDFGIVNIVKTYFPNISLHASTQMAVHNLDGALSLKNMGFSRVVLARELTFKEIEYITKNAGIETEVFIHGALCYSYSGLCLYSSMQNGKSANRGSCSYPCRQLCCGIHPYSMKDLSLGESILKLRDVGVTSLKIEGRKKSPLYVAATADYYYRILNYKNTDNCLKNIQKIFARPYTNLHFDGKNDDVIDKYFCGPRGVKIGKVEYIKNGKIKFKTSEKIEKHDGILITVKENERPFGFSIDKMFVDNHFVFSASAGEYVEIYLPSKYPNIKIGDFIYCSSSNNLKSLYPFKLSLLKNRLVKPCIDIVFEMTSNFIKISGNGVNVVLNGNFSKSNRSDVMKKGVLNVLSKLGESNYQLGNLEYKNVGYFAPISVLNKLRRDFVDKLNFFDNKIYTKNSIKIETPFKINSNNSTGYIVKIDSMNYLDKFSDKDISEISEFIIDINCDVSSSNIPFEKIRVSLPIINRMHNYKTVFDKINMYLKLGIDKFSISNLYGINLLKEFNINNFSCDFYMYSMNYFAVDFLIKNGAVRVTLSPEDSLENIVKTLSTNLSEKIDLVVYSDIPLFISDNLINNNIKIKDNIVITDNCNYVFGRDHYCIIDDVKDLKPKNFRIDFCFKKYSPDEAYKIYKTIKSGKSLDDSVTKSNLYRGFC